MASLWQRILGLDEQRSSPPITIPTRQEYAPNNRTALSLTSVYRAIQIIATPISKMPLETFRYGGGLEQKIENPALVNNPSLNDSRRDFLFQTVTSLALEGNAYWYKNFDSRGQVNDLTILPANAVHVRLDGPTGLSGKKVFDYQGVTYTANEIEHLRLFTEPAILKGISPIQACWQDVNGALELRNFASTWFSTAGVPTGVLKTSKPLSKEDAAQVTANWHEKQATRQVAVLSEGFDYSVIAPTANDVMYTQQLNQSVQNIARMFGIPARLLLTGVDGTSDTYSNLTDENQIFYRHTIMAYTDAIADALSNCLPRSTRTQFNFEGLFKADIASRYDYYKVGVEGGWLTTDEVRAKENL
jgi:HK97 family phage portal protein